MTRIRMRKSTLECGIVPQHQITLTLTPSVFPGQRAGSVITSKPTTAQRQKRAKHATFEPLLYKSLDQLASNNIHPRSLSSTRGFQQCPAQKAPSEGAPSNMLAQTSPSRFTASYRLTQFCWDGIQYACTTSPVQRITSTTEKPPHKRGAAFYKTMRSFNRAWVQPSQAFDQERARREIYSAASSVAGFSALGAAAFFLG